MMAQTFKPTINAGGIQSNQKGIDYQINLLQLFAVESYKNNLEFEIFTEAIQAGRFDDVVYSYKDAEAQKKLWRFVQAKQKSNPVELYKGSFIKDDNYNLYKYFISVTSNSFKKIFPDCIDYSIVTNNKLIVEDLWPYLYFKENSEEDRTVEDPIFGKSGRKFKFDQAKSQENFTFLKEFFLAIELLNFTFGNKCDFRILKFSRAFLRDNVFDESVSPIKFKESFLDKSDQALDSFHIALGLAVDSGLVNVPIDIDKEDLKINLKDSLEFKDFSDKFLKKYSEFEEDSQTIQEQLEEFMEKLLIITELTESDITGAWVKTLIEIFNKNSLFNEDNLDLMIAGFNEDIRKKLKIDLGSPINNSLIEKFIINQKLKIINPEVKSKNEKIFSREGTEFLEFEAVLLPDKNIIILEVAKGDNFLQALRLFREFNSIFIGKESLEFQEKSLELFEILENCVCVVDSEEVDLHKRLLEILKRGLEKNKRRKLIFICNDKKIFNLGETCDILKMDQITCKNLTENSLLNFMKEKLINFQGKEVRLEEIISDPNSMKSLPLQPLLDLWDLGKPETSIHDVLSKDIYISRTLERKVHVKPKIIDDKKSNVFKDTLAFNDSNFKHSGSVHYLELNKPTELSTDSKDIKTSFIEKKPNDLIIWKKSNCSLDPLRIYLDEDNVTKIPDQDIVKESSRFILISDIPGMGKTFYLNKLVQILKDTLPNHWIIGIDLKLYTNVFNSPKSSDLLTVFITEILKLKDPVELAIFQHILEESGNIQIVFDGFDEISPNYKNIVINLIKELLKTRVSKVYLSTRPQWGQTLENEFFEFKFSFAPFSQEDQESFLVNSWRTLADQIVDVDQLAEGIIKITNKSISDKERKFTGIPLITKLIGEYFKNEIQENFRKFSNLGEFLESIESKSIKLYKLFEHFIDKNIERFVAEKIVVPASSPLYKDEVKIRKSFLYKRYGRLASDFIFDKKMTKEIVKDSKHENETLERYGIIYLENDQYKFQHQSYAEFLVSRYLFSKIHKYKIKKFLFEVVFIGVNYQMVRTFLEHCISEMGDLTFEKDLIVANITCLHRAVQEGNQHTFNQIFKSLIKSDLSPPELKEILLKVDGKGATFLFYYYHYCKDTINIMDLLREKGIDLDFIKEILTFQNKCDGLVANILIASARSGENYLKLLKWIIKNFREDDEFIEEIFLSVDQEGNGILHNIISQIDEVTFDEILKIFQAKKREFIQKLLKLPNKENHNFLFSYCNSSSNGMKISLILSKLRNSLGLETNFIQDIICSKGINEYTILHNFARKFQNKKEKFLTVFQDLYSWIKENIPGFDMRGFLKMREKDGAFFFYFIVLNDKNNEALPVLMDILGFLKSEFPTDPQFLEEIVCSRDGDNNTIFHHMAEKSNKKGFLKMFTELYEWIRTNTPGIDLKSMLLVKNVWGSFFLHHIVFYNEINESTIALLNVLNFLKVEYSSDPDFIKRLVCSPDEKEGTILHYFAQKSRAEYFQNVFIEFFRWIQDNVQDFDLKQFLMAKDQSGYLFYIYVFFYNKSNNATTSLLEIFNFLITEFGPDFIQQMIFSRDKNESTILFYFAERENFSRNFIEFFKWTKIHLLDLNWEKFLCETDKWGQHFFYNIVLNKKSKNNVVLELLLVLGFLLEKTGVDLVKKLIKANDNNNYTILHYFAEQFNVDYFADNFSALYVWLKSNIPDWELRRLLFRKDKQKRSFFRIFYCKDENEVPLGKLVRFLESEGYSEYDLLEQNENPCRLA